MSNDLLKAFQEAYRNLDLLPLLEQKELEKFRVDYGSEVIEELVQLVEYSPSGDGKIIFSGHRGCGKSTLLAEFGRQCADRYFVVFFSISDTIEMSDVNYINILFAIAVKLMYEAERNLVAISPASKKAFYNWFATKTQVDSKGSSYEASLNLKLLENIQFRLKAEHILREEIKREFQKNFIDLVARINEIAASIYGATGKDVIVIIDDLDKLDLAVAKTIYQENIKALLQPNFRIVLTIPVSALREVALMATVETETNSQIVLMAVAKLFAKGERRLPNATPQSKANQVLCDVLKKRIAGELIEPQTVEEIIKYSGGVLRELIRITNECCRICLRLIRRHPERQDIKINDEILKEAITKLRIDFDTRIGIADYEILETTYKEFKPNDPKDQRFLDLLHGLYVLEYRNAQLWYDVHPIVIELLKERGKI